MSDTEHRPPAHFAPAADDGGDLGPIVDADNPPWETEAQQAEVDGCEHPVRGYTGTSCPECSLAQMWCPGGVTCPNGHGFGHGEEGVPIPPQPAPEATVAPEPIPQPEPAPEPVPAPVLPDPGPVPEPTTEPAPEPVPEPKPKRRAARKPKVTEPVPTGDRSPVEDPVADEAYRRQQREAVARRLDEIVMGDGYERIIEHVFTIDPWAAYEELQKRLTLPVPAHAQTKTLLFDELDAAELRAKEAHQLFVSAKETVRRFEHDMVVLSVDMRSQATAALQQEKDAGQRSKQITDADVESRMASMFPDEWRQAEMRKSRAKLMVDHMGRLSDAWKERARDLRSMFDGK